MFDAIVHPPVRHFNFSTIAALHNVHFNSFLARAYTREHDNDF